MENNDAKDSKEKDSDIEKPRKTKKDRSLHRLKLLKSVKKKESYKPN